MSIDLAIVQSQSEKLSSIDLAIVHSRSEKWSFSTIRANFVNVFPPVNLNMVFEQAVLYSSVEDNVDIIYEMLPNYQSIQNARSAMQALVDEETVKNKKIDLSQTVAMFSGGSNVLFLSIFGINIVDRFCKAFNGTGYIPSLAPSLEHCVSLEILSVCQKSHEYLRNLSAIQLEMLIFSRDLTGLILCDALKRKKLWGNETCKAVVETQCKQFSDGYTYADSNDAVEWESQIIIMLDLKTASIEQSAISDRLYNLFTQCPFAYQANQNNSHHLAYSVTVNSSTIIITQHDSLEHSTPKQTILRSPGKQLLYILQCVLKCSSSKERRKMKIVCKYAQVKQQMDGTTCGVHSSGNVIDILSPNKVMSSLFVTKSSEKMSIEEGFAYQQFTILYMIIPIIMQSSSTYLHTVPVASGPSVAAAVIPNVAISAATKSLVCGDFCGNH